MNSYKINVVGRKFLLAGSILIIAYAVIGMVTIVFPEAWKFYNSINQITIPDDGSMLWDSGVAPIIGSVLHYIVLLVIACNIKDWWKSQYEPVSMRIYILCLAGYVYVPFFKESGQSYGFLVKIAMVLCIIGCIMTWRSVVTVRRNMAEKIASYILDISCGILTFLSTMYMYLSLNLMSVMTSTEFYRQALAVIEPEQLKYWKSEMLCFYFFIAFIEFVIILWHFNNFRGVAFPGMLTGALVILLVEICLYLGWKYMKFLVYYIMSVPVLIIVLAGLYLFGAIIITGEEKKKIKNGYGTGF